MNTLKAKLALVALLLTLPFFGLACGDASTTTNDGTATSDVSAGDEASDDTTSGDEGADDASGEASGDEDASEATSEGEDGTTSVDQGDASTQTPEEDTTGVSVDDAGPVSEDVASCTPACGDKTCGDDGCGGSCGECQEGEACTGEGMCAALCIPDCAGASCGDDGCGGSCGECASDESCAEGACVTECTPDCSGASCGDDGCGGSCGECASDETCTEGACVQNCTPDCSGASCGDDGCGGSCGECPDGESCTEGECVAEGACTNAADLDVITNFDVAQASQDAAFACLDGFSVDLECATQNIANASGMSLECAACFGEQAVCVAANCAFQCFNPSSASCNTCRDENCSPLFEPCAGIEPLQ